jgi:hypothetical protein
MQFVTYKHNGEWTGGVEQDGVIVNLFRVEL